MLFVTGCRSSQHQSDAEKLSASPIDGENTTEEDESDFFPTELVLPPPNANLPVTFFREIWAYLVTGREQGLNLNYPVSDLVYFGAEVDSYGKLTDVPNFRRISAFRGRKHLVAACSSRSLTHFVLMEGSQERRDLIRDLLSEAQPYDGLQIDFEYIPARDGNAFLSFLSELRLGLGNKMLSVALPARTKTSNEDVYDYAKIMPLVDRILVMAYDEAWSGSAPGPIASMGWCQRVAQYSLSIIGAEKLVMGLPFYGRSWGSENVSRAYIYSTIDEIIKEQKINEIKRDNGIPNFKYEKTLQVTVFYEDAYSLSARLEMYKKMGVSAVGFWRLGQETLDIWPHIMLEKAAVSSIK